MNITIKNKDYCINFGVAFIRALDNKYFSTGVGGAKFGLGLEVTVPKLLGGDAVALSDVLYEGTASEKSRPTQKDVDSYVDSVEDIDELFSEVIEELKNTNATKKKMDTILEAMETPKK